MKTELFEGKQWERHGDYWILVGGSKVRIPAAILISIAPRKEETVINEPRIAATIQRA